MKGSVSEWYILKFKADILILILQIRRNWDPVRLSHSWETVELGLEPPDVHPDPSEAAVSLGDDLWQCGTRHPSNQPFGPPLQLALSSLASHTHSLHSGDFSKGHSNGTPMTHSLPHRAREWGPIEETQGQVKASGLWGLGEEVTDEEQSGGGAVRTQASGHLLPGAAWLGAGSSL